MKKIITNIFFFLITITAISQTDSTFNEEKRIWKNLKHDGKVALKSVGHSLSRPIHWQGKDFLTAGGIIAGTSILYLSDNEAKRYFEKQEKDVPGVIKSFGWYFGSPQNFFMVSAGIYGFGLVTDNEKVRRTGILIISSATTTGIIQSLSKTIVGRARPNNGNRDDFDPLSNKPGYHSFPSGHSILSFSMAHSIAKQFDSLWVKAGIYSIGSIAPISRLWKGAHWLSDVGLSLALSIVVVDSIDNFMQKNEYYDYSKPKTISWRISAGVGTIGLVGTF